MAETKDHAGWHVFKQLAQQTSGSLQKALQAAVGEVEEQEDEHLEWARESLTLLCLQMINEQTPPGRGRWQRLITGPEPPIEVFHPAPFANGLLEGANLPVWVETPISRSMRASGRTDNGPDSKE